MTILLTLPLLFGATGGSAPPGPSLIEDTAGEVSYASLVDEYDAAVATWKDALRAEEDRKAKRALRKQKPALDFYPRFQTMANAGEGQALIWMMGNLRDAGFKKKEASAMCGELAGTLVSQHLEQEWFADATAVMFKQKRVIGLERLDVLMLEVVGSSPSKILQAQTLAQLAGIFAKSKDETEMAKGEAYFERLETDYSEEVLQKALTGERFRKTFLRVGKMAPDFEAITAAGEEFKLSDYRGKVTLIDFWGFW